MKPCPLSSRQIEILGWQSQGKTSVETAAILGLSPRSIESHTLRAKNVTGAATLTALVAMALRNGWMQ